LKLQREGMEVEDGEEQEEPDAPDLVDMADGDGAEEQHGGAASGAQDAGAGGDDRGPRAKLGFRGRGGKSREWLSQGAVSDAVLSAQTSFLPRGEQGRALKPEKADGEGAKKKKKPAAGPGLNSGQVSQGRGLPAVRGRGKLTGGDETRRPVSEYYPAPDMEDEDGTEPSEYAEDEYEEKAVKATVPKNPLCLW
jgi:hypothetical protein